MPRRPPPTPLILAKGPMPPRGTPRHQLPDIPRAALIVAETAHGHSCNIVPRPQHRERSMSIASNTSTSSLSSNLSWSSSSLSSYHPPPVPPSMYVRAVTSGMTMSNSWPALDVARQTVVPPPPVMLAYFRPLHSEPLQESIPGREWIPLRS